MEKILDTGSIERLANILGTHDKNLKMIEKEYGVSVVARGTEIKLSGGEAEVSLAALVLENLFGLSDGGGLIEEQNVKYAISMANAGEQVNLSNLDKDLICVTSRGKPVKAKTMGQKKYIDAIRNNTIVFGIGPAGTGKTYLAVAMAVTAFRKKEVARIILTRPAVEAGEKLGFLPGDLQTKVDPYLRPLYDALGDMLGTENFLSYLEKGMIEVAPLAYMRGRTLDDSFIILDEAQNTTPEQMKMFLTRIGFGSKVIVTGDITQIDLPSDKKSGLKDTMRILKNIDDIAFSELSERDVVRHPLVQSIVKAYEKAEKEREMRKKR